MSVYGQWLQFRLGIFLKSLVLVPELAWMLVLSDLGMFLSSLVPSRSDGYSEKFGGYQLFLIDTLNAPSAYP